MYLKQITERILEGTVLLGQIMCYRSVKDLCSLSFKYPIFQSSAFSEDWLKIPKDLENDIYRMWQDEWAKVFLSLFYDLTPTKHCKPYVLFRI